MVTMKTNISDGRNSSSPAALRCFSLQIEHWSGMVRNGPEKRRGLRNWASNETKSQKVDRGRGLFTYDALPGTWGAARNWEGLADALWHHNVRDVAWKRQTLRFDPCPAVAGLESPYHVESDARCSTFKPSKFHLRTWTVLQNLQLHVLAACLTKRWPVGVPFQVGRAVSQWALLGSEANCATTIGSTVQLRLTKVHHLKEPLHWRELAARWCFDLCQHGPGFRMRQSLWRSCYRANSAPLQLTNFGTTFNHLWKIQIIWAQLSKVTRSPLEHVNKSPMQSLGQTQRNIPQHVGKQLWMESSSPRQQHVWKALQWQAHL